MHLLLSITLICVCSLHLHAWVMMPRSSNRRLTMQIDNINTANSDICPKSMSKSVHDKLHEILINGLAVSTAAFGIGGLASSASAEEVVKKTKKPKVMETDIGIKFIVVKPGTGPYPSDGDFVVISYEGFLSDGTLFDSTKSKTRKPVSFRMGKKQIIPGIESVVSYMQPGEEVTCTIPSQYAYGAKGVCVEGQGCLVPPNETLKYVIKLISAGAGYN